MALLHRVPTLDAYMAEIKRMRSLGVQVLQHETIRDGDAGKELQYVLFDTEANGKYVVGLVYYPDNGAPIVFSPTPAKTRPGRSRSLRSPSAISMGRRSTGQSSAGPRSR